MSKKIAVVAANGRTGQLIVSEAIERGMDVTAIVRSTNKSAAQHELIRDVFALTREDLSGFDAVIDAFGAWTPDTIPGIGEAIIHLATLLSNTTTHLVIVGGAGSLFVDTEHTTTVDQGANFPEEWKPLSASHGRGLAYLLATSTLDWTYVSPAADFQAEGQRTGEYTLAGEELTLNAAGQSTLSYADFAIAVTDIAESGLHKREHVSVVSK